MEMWNGDVEWRCGMEMWNGDVEWRCGMEMWNGDLEHRCNENWIKTCSMLVVKGSAIVGRSKNTVSAEIHFPKSDTRDIQNVRKLVIYIYLTKHLITL